MSPTGGGSGQRGAELLRQLGDWNRHTRLGIAFDSSTGFRLPGGAVFSSDAAWVERSRWEALPLEAREGFPPLAPDVVFEVRSRSQGPDELREKAWPYLEAKTRLVVLTPTCAGPRCTGLAGRQNPAGIPKAFP